MNRKQRRAAGIKTQGRLYKDMLNAHDFDARFAAMREAAGITDHSDPADIVALHNRFTAELAAEGVLDAYKAHVFADLAAAGLMPALLTVAKGRGRPAPTTNHQPNSPGESNDRHHDRRQR